MHLTHVYIFALSLCILSSCQAYPKYPRESRNSSEYLNAIQKKIDAIVEPYSSSANIGIYVAPINGSDVIYQKNAEHLFNPGSVAKIFTVAAALHYLGPHFRFRTELLTNQVSASGEEIQDLYIRGDGDPSLTDSNFASLLEKLKQSRIKTISGDILIDDTKFDATVWGKGWFWDDLGKGFSAPIGAFNINQNQIDLTVAPGLRKGLPIRIFHSDMARYFHISVEALTTAKGASTPNSVYYVVSKDRKNIHDDDIDQAGLAPGDTVSIQGHLQQNAIHDDFEIAIQDTNELLVKMIKDKLRSEGIRFHGEVKKRAVPDNSVSIAFHDSAALGELILGFLKNSDGPAIEAILKSIGAHVAGAPGSFKAGLEATRGYLNERAGLEAGAYAFEDGSGVSRLNMVSPRQIVKLLNFAYHDFEIGPEFVAALPLAGYDGTLAKRFLNYDHIVGQVRAKTGSSEGVNNLAGYLLTEDHQVLVFVIFFNDYVGSPGPYKQLQAKLLYEFWLSPSAVLNPSFVVAEKCAEN